MHPLRPLRGALPVARNHHAAISIQAPVRNGAGLESEAETRAASGGERVALL